MPQDEYDTDINPYEESHLRHDAWLLRHLEFKERILSMSENAGFKRQTHNALKVLLHDIMSENLLLSNQTPPTKTLKSWFNGESAFNQLEYTKLSIAGCIERFKCSIHPTDKSKDVLYQILADVENYTENATLTRTVGDQREGVVNRIEHTKTTQELRQYETEERKQKEIKTGGLF